MTRPSPQPAPRSGLARRFGAYFLGLAIGLILLGLFQSQRAQRASRESKDEQTSGANDAPEPRRADEDR